jgi:uncharacterized membrane protein
MPQAREEAQAVSSIYAREGSPSPSWLTHLTAGKIFSWIGGLLLFLGVVFAVKYSIENNLISPFARVALGAACGLGLIAASFVVKAERFKVTSDTLCAAGLAVLYGVSFSAKYYQLITPQTAFAMMGIISLASFRLAVRKEAQYIAYLGVITGFLTPLIINTGSQNYLMLFAYLAFINAGAIGAGIKMGWDTMICTSLVFTLLFQFVWFAPKFNPAKIADFCIITAAYTAAAASLAWLFRARLIGSASEYIGHYLMGSTRKFLGYYIALSFLFIFLTDFSLPAMGLALFVNALIAALFYSDAQLFNAPFKIVNIAAFLLLAFWVSSANCRAENGIILLVASLVFTGLNALVSMSRNVKEDTFSAALPLGALLLLFWMPKMNLWTLHVFGLAFAAMAIIAAFRANRAVIGYFAMLVFGFFVLKHLFQPWHGSGLLGLATGTIFALGLMFALLIGGYLPGKGKNFGIAAGVMPYLFLAVFINRSPFPEEIRGLLFCAAITAIILAISVYKKNAHIPFAAAIGAFLPLLFVAPSQAGLKFPWALIWLNWGLFFAYPFIARMEKKSLPWRASAVAGMAILLCSLINRGYANLTADTAILAAAYGLAAYFVARYDKESEGGGPPLYIPLAWLCLFVFVNVQIANYFSPKEYVVFAAWGNLAKTVAYTLAWGIFGMATLFARIGKKGRGGMVAGIALVSIALAKLFLSDVWMLSTPYRIVVFLGMAVILIAGSFLYQALAGKKGDG